MLNANQFIVSFENANIKPPVEFIEEAGLYKLIIKKVFLYENLGKDGSTHDLAYILCESVKDKRLLSFNLFLGKNGSTSYLSKDGKQALYVDTRRLLAMAFLSGISDIFAQAVKEKQSIFGEEKNGTLLKIFEGKNLVLGFDKELYTNLAGKTSSRLVLERVFSEHGQSVEELKKGLPAEDYTKYKPSTRTNSTNQAPQSEKLVNFPHDDKSEIPF